jgi:hypothetical protein
VATTEASKNVREILIAKQLIFVCAVSTLAHLVPNGHNIIKIVYILDIGRPVLSLERSFNAHFLKGATHHHLHQEMRLVIQQIFNCDNRSSTPSKTEEVCITKEVTSSKLRTNAKHEVPWKYATLLQVENICHVEST